MTEISSCVYECRGKIQPTSANKHACNDVSRITLNTKNVAVTKCIWTDRGWSNINFLLFFETKRPPWNNVHVSAHQLFCEAFWLKLNELKKTFECGRAFDFEQIANNFLSEPFPETHSKTLVDTNGHTEISLNVFRCQKISIRIFFPGWQIQFRGKRNFEKSVLFWVQSAFRFRSGMQVSTFEVRSNIVASVKSRGEVKRGVSKTGSCRKTWLDEQTNSKQVRGVDKINETVQITH